MTSSTDKPTSGSGPAAAGATTQNDVSGKPPKNDGPLDSIGKAVTDTVTTAADDEEPHEHGLPRVKPGG